MSKEIDSCVKPAAGPLLQEEDSPEELTPQKEKQMTLARVGKKAPNFEASAYVAGEGFKPVKLSDYEGKWVTLCFYPGDFTFV